MQTALKEQHENWKAARARLFAPAPAMKRPTETVVAIVKETEEPTAVQVDTTEYVDHNAHVKAYERRLMEIAVNPMTVFIKDRCAEMGASYAEVIGQGRRHKISMIRHQLMWETITKFGISYPHLGRLFGHRDHTSCLYAIRKIEALQAAAAE